MAIAQAEIRAFLGRHFAAQLEALAIEPAELPDDLDLLERGVIDSFGLIELIGSIDEEFDLFVDFEEIDPEQLTIVGPLCRFVAKASEGDE